MEQSKPKLYYVSWYYSQGHYNGSPILHFEFINRETKEPVFLHLCDEYLELQYQGFSHYYGSVHDFDQDYDILWFITEHIKDDITNTYVKLKMLLNRKVEDYNPFVDKRLNYFMEDSSKARKN